MNIKLRLSALLTLLILLCAAHGLGEYWPHDSSHAAECRANRPGCRILQMVMMGCFDYAEAPDSLDERVLSAVLPQLCAIEEEEFGHFCDEFGVEEAPLRTNYYIALANCLLSDIRINPDPGGNATLVRRVLLLFLDPDSETDAQAQKDAIRSEMTDDVLMQMANELSLPQDFVSYLLSQDHWRPSADSPAP